MKSNLDFISVIFWRRHAYPRRIRYVSDCLFSQKEKTTIANNRPSIHLFVQTISIPIDELPIKITAVPEIHPLHIKIVHKTMRWRCVKGFPVKIAQGTKQR